jgi:pSer/pThr/pTyr-binding forkhead associated (FHA) protein
MPDAAPTLQHPPSIPWSVIFGRSLAAGKGKEAMAKKVAILHNNIDKTRNYVLHRENVLGRAPDSHIFCDDRRVSRRHARIAAVARSQGYFIEDICARGVYVNFKRIHGRHPLTEADRICLLRFHNVHPLELEKMTPEDLKACADDPRNHNIDPIVDLTFGYVDPSEVTAQTAGAPGSAADDHQPKGLLGRLKSLFSKGKGEETPARTKAKKRKEPEAPKIVSPKLTPKDVAAAADKKAKEKKKKKSREWQPHREERYKL